MLSSFFKALSATSYPSNLPSRPRSNPGVLGPPCEPIEFQTAGERVELIPGIEVEQVLAALVASHNVLEVTGLDSAGLLARLSKKWTPEQALKECE